ncbi:MAG: phosphatase PAP2-related protein [Candidatus Paceibacterota bacterium]
MRYLKDKYFVVSTLLGSLFLFLAIIINSYAVTYANRTASNSVTDIVLSNTQAYDVDGTFVYGAALLVLIIITLCLIRLERTPFILKSASLFVVIRSFFLSLTHISPFPMHAAIGTNIFTSLFPSIFMGDDLFFSGHAGLPFLLALIFWDDVLLRTIFLGFSVLFSIVVLLGHLHYSIDVASAFFITFTIFVIAKKFFKKDWDLLNGTI